jgi:ABC-type sugar transport system ATPase subunit
VGRPLDLYNNPANKFVAGFIGAPQMNFFKGRLEGQSLRLENGIARAVGPRGQQAITLGIRPEAIAVSLDGAGDAQVTVQNFEQLGAVTYIYASFGNGERITVQLPEQVPLRRGQEIGVTLPTEAFHIFGEDEQKLVAE